MVSSASSAKASMTVPVLADQAKMIAFLIELGQGDLDVRGAVTCSDERKLERTGPRFAGFGRGGESFDDDVVAW